MLSIFFLKGAVSEVSGFKRAKYPMLSSGIFLDLGAHGQTIHQNMFSNETAVCEVSRHSDEHTKLKMSHNVNRCSKHTHKPLKLVHTLKHATLPTGCGHVPFSLVAIFSEKWQIKPLNKKNAYSYCILSLGSVWWGEGLLNICRYGCWLGLFMVFLISHVSFIDECNVLSILTAVFESDTGLLTGKKGENQ